MGITDCPKSTEASLGRAKCKITGKTLTRTVVTVLVSKFPLTRTVLVSDRSLTKSVVTVLVSDRSLMKSVITVLVSDRSLILHFARPIDASVDIRVYMTSWT